MDYERHILLSCRDPQSSGLELRVAHTVGPMLGVPYMATLGTQCLLGLRVKVGVDVVEPEMV